MSKFFTSISEKRKNCFDTSTSLGFTLIELLVVIVIIGIIATLTTITLISVRVKARDARRISDLKQISSALELYMADNNAYPTLITPGLALTSPDGSKTFMNKVPNNPTPRAEGACANLEYQYSGSAGDFSLLGCLAKASGEVPAGAVIYSKAGLTSSLVYPNTPSIYCSATVMSRCDSSTTSNLQNTLDFDNVYGSIFNSDSWSSEYLERGLVFDFASVANRNVMIRWNAVINPYPYGGSFYLLNVSMLLETSTDNTSWTTHKSLNYSYPAQAGTPIVNVPVQFDNVSANSRYFRLRFNSPSNSLVASSYLYIDGIASY